MTSRETIEIPVDDEDILPYISEIFTLGEGDFPTSCVVIFEYLPSEIPEGETEMPGAWSVRTGGDSRFSSLIGILNMAAHQMAHDAGIRDFDDD